MVTRVVKMHFRTEELPAFLDLFESTKTRIRNAEGCLHLELLQHNHHKEVLFTLSRWEDESCLEKYRASDLFRDTWRKTRSLFSHRPEAWTLNQIARTDG